MLLFDINWEKIFFELFLSDMNGEFEKFEKFRLFAIDIEHDEIYFYFSTVNNEDLDKLYQTKIFFELFVEF